MGRKWEQQQLVAQLFRQVETLAMKASRSLDRDEKLPATELLEQLQGAYEDSMSHYRKLVADYYPDSDFDR